VWFCNRQCQIVAARQGHSGINCRAADGAPTRADIEVAPRLADTAEPRSSLPLTSTVAPAATTCQACGKSGCKLLLCGRCRNAWFCSRKCQIVARKELGHMGANCRAADAAQTPSTSAAPSQPSTPMDVAELKRGFGELMAEAVKAEMTNTRVGNLYAAEKFKEAATVADLIGGAEGAMRRADADQCLSSSYASLGEFAAAARAACSTVWAARAFGSRTMLVTTVVKCGDVAMDAPGEMASAERESREEERRSNSSSYGGFDLSQEGRISLPITPAALSRLCLAYYQAAVAICDATLVGGRVSLAANDERRVPSLQTEANARASLGTYLHMMGLEGQRGLELLRQAVALRRQSMRMAAPGSNTLDVQRGLADDLSVLGASQVRDSDGMAEAEACLREALERSEGLGDVLLTVKTLTHLINLCGAPHATMGPADAEAFRLRLNQILVQMGRSPETSCSICLEPLAPSADGAAEDAAGGGGGSGAGDPSDSCVRVLGCCHQFHRGCLFTWRHTGSNLACPICRK